MKSKLSLIIAVVVVISVGFFVGQWQSRRTLESRYREFISSDAYRATADFSHAAGLLRDIRNGDTNSAIETLEADLDLNIMVIGASTEATPVSERDKQWMSRIRWLHDYRAEHPRKTEFAFTDELVAQYLSLVDTNR